MKGKTCRRENLVNLFFSLKTFAPPAAKNSASHLVLHDDAIFAHHYIRKCKSVCQTDSHFRAIAQR